MFGLGHLLSQGRILCFSYFGQALGFIPLIPAMIVSVGQILGRDLFQELWPVLKQIIVCLELDLFQEKDL